MDLPVTKVTESGCLLSDILTNGIPKLPKLPKLQVSLLLFICVQKCKKMKNYSKKL